jgi:hypothetical protein
MQKGECFRPFLVLFREKPFVGLQCLPQAFFRKWWFHFIFLFNNPYIPILGPHATGQKYWPFIASLEEKPSFVGSAISTPRVMSKFLIPCVTFLFNPSVYTNIRNQRKRGRFPTLPCDVSRETLFHGPHDVKPHGFRSKLVISSVLSYLHHPYMPILGPHVRGGLIFDPYSCHLKRNLIWWLGATNIRFITKPTPQF